MFLSELSNEWVTDGMVLESSVLELDRTSTVTCSTFHLSAFAVAEEEALSGVWSAVGQLAGFDVLQQVRRTALDINYEPILTHKFRSPGTSDQNVFLEHTWWTFGPVDG